MDMAMLVPVVIGVVFVVALGILGGYWALYGEWPRKKKLESLSIMLKYERERIKKLTNENESLKNEIDILKSAFNIIKKD